MCTREQKHTAGANSAQQRPWENVRSKACRQPKLCGDSLSKNEFSKSIFFLPPPRAKSQGSVATLVVFQHFFRVAFPENTRVAWFFFWRSGVRSGGNPRAGPTETVCGNIKRQGFGDQLQTGRLSTYWTGTYLFLDKRSKKNTTKKRAMRASKQREQKVQKSIQYKGVKTQGLEGEVRKQTGKDTPPYTRGTNKGGRTDLNTRWAGGANGDYHSRRNKTTNNNIQIAYFPHTWRGFTRFECEEIWFFCLLTETLKIRRCFPPAMADLCTHRVLLFY